MNRAESIPRVAQTVGRMLPVPIVGDYPPIYPSVSFRQAQLSIPKIISASRPSEPPDCSTETGTYIDAADIASIPLHGFAFLARCRQKAACEPVMFTLCSHRALSKRFFQASRYG
jgi:hypothetical protein